ncbi:MAG: hypothetical protein J6Y78_08445 [Paludibacteraceae bacterium]|nr:hypothetical protein [Paludibacteraceae bacterium]
MAFFELNGTPIRTPSRGLEFLLSTAVNSGRNANNVVIGEKVGRDTLKYNNLTWKWLSASEWHTICGILDSFFVMAKMWHPAKQKFVTIQIYPGDRSGQPYWLNSNGEPTAYTDCKVNIIDTNVTDID